MKASGSRAEMDRRSERRRRELVRRLLVASRAKVDVVKRPQPLLSRQRSVR